MRLLKIRYKCRFTRPEQRGVNPPYLITNQRLDRVLIDRQEKTFVIAELTICFETNIQAAHERK